MKQFPWLSLAILFAAYTTFSWFLTHTTVSWLSWAIVLTFTLLQALLLTTLFDGLRRFLDRWLKSDVGYFTLIMMGSLSLTAALVWFKVFGYFLVLVAAEVLARLDLQDRRFNRVQSLFVLTIVSLAGLAAGWTTSQTPWFGGHSNIL